MTNKGSGIVSEYIEYRGVRAKNREIFLLNYPTFVRINDRLHEGFGILAEGLRGKRDVEGKSYVSFIPFLFLMQRQVFSAFDHLASFQAYQGWIMIRPAIEIPLIMGKWIDDPATAEIWKRREVDPKPYQREYSGFKMRSVALPRSDQIQSVLKKLNDDFLHPNPYYYHRHLSLAAVEDGEISITLEYFDPQDIAELYTVAFLHLIAMVLDSVREMLMNLVGSISGSTGITEEVESNFQQKVEIICNNDPKSKLILVDLGCWPVGDKA